MTRTNECASHFYPPGRLGGRIFWLDPVLAAAPPRAMVKPGALPAPGFFSICSLARSAAKRTPSAAPWCFFGVAASYAMVLGSCFP